MNLSQYDEFKNKVGDISDKIISELKGEMK